MNEDSTKRKLQRTDYEQDGQFHISTSGKADKQNSAERDGHPKSSAVLPRSGIFILFREFST
ncbi:MAG: hypothetical protein M3Z26_18280, partial [Bacteroidota bacterium]|nr:hypothetical protein [Bacteroidota bacterium]